MGNHSLEVPQSETPRAASEIGPLVGACSLQNHKLRLLACVTQSRQHDFKLIVLLHTKSKGALKRRVTWGRSNDLSLVGSYFICLRKQSQGTLSPPPFTVLRLCVDPGTTPYFRKKKKKKTIFALTCLFTAHSITVKTFEFPGKHRLHLCDEFKDINVISRSVRRIDEFVLVNHFGIPRSKS